MHTATPGSWAARDRGSQGAGGDGAHGGEDPQGADAPDSLGDDALRCPSCGTPWAARDDVFPMTPEGAEHVELNPHGWFHDFVTVLRAHNLALEGDPTTEHTWFPGYAWTIAWCRGCGAHAGWRFDAVAAASPPTFWGLKIRG